ncbi:MAG: Rpn family recombination-promoting nuclease/putative transposase [Planctomycetaceae bacterium]
MLLYSDLPERLLYYWAKVFTDQLSEGLDYSLLQPTISICFLNQILFPEIATFHSRFQLVDPRFGHCLTDRIEMHLIELPKFTMAATDLAEDLDQWLYFLCHGADLKSQQLPNRLWLPEVGKAVQELEIMNQIDLERERYLARQKAQRDELWKENWYKRQHTEGLEK